MSLTGLAKFAMAIAGLGCLLMATLERDITLAIVGVGFAVFVLIDEVRDGFARLPDKKEK